MRLGYALISVLLLRQSSQCSMLVAGDWSLVRIIVSFWSAIAKGASNVFIARPTPFITNPIPNPGAVLTMCPFGLVNCPLVNRVSQCLCGVKC